MIELSSYCPNCRRVTASHMQFAGGAEFPLPPVSFICEVCRWVKEQVNALPARQKDSQC